MRQYLGDCSLVVSIDAEEATAECKSVLAAIERV